jgi:beta-galactosidase GanA
MAATLIFATPASGVPKVFWGVVPQLQQSDVQLRRLQQGGVDSVRLPVAWSSVQPSERGGFDWSAVDGQIAAAARARLEGLPFL